MYGTTNVKFAAINLLHILGVSSASYDKNSHKLPHKSTSHFKVEHKILSSENFCLSYSS